VPNPSASAHPERLVQLAAATRDRSLSLRPAAGHLGDDLCRLRARCPTLLPPVPPLDEDLVALLRRAEALARRIDDVAAAFLRADGAVAVHVPGLGWAAVPRPAVAAPVGVVVRLTTAELRAHGAWVLGAGQWALRNRAIVRNLLGVRGPVQALLGGTVSLGWLARIAARAGLSPRLGAALAVTSAVNDLRAVVAQGNPIRAFQRRGADYLADRAQVRLDLSFAAFLAAPSAPTGITVLATGATWANWATWDERRRFAGRVVGAADRTQDRWRDGMVANVHGATEVVRGLAGVPGVAPPAPLPPGARRQLETVLDRVDDSAARVDEIADRGVAQVRSTAHVTHATVSRAVEGALDAGADAVDEVGEAIGNLVRR